MLDHLHGLLIQLDINHR